jgi:carboxyl-terminal processing protease
VVVLLLVVALASSLVTQIVLAGEGGLLSRLWKSSGLASMAGADSLDEAELDKLLRTYRLIKENYVTPVDDQTLLDGAIQGMVESLEDPHSTYMDPHSAEQFQDSLESSFEGIGAQVIMQNNRVTILAPIKGSPAEKAGLRVNDQILAVNGESLEGLSLTEAVAKIRGPKGSKAELLVARPGLEEPLKITVIRDEIPLETVYAEKIGAYGLIQITQFSLNTAQRFEEELKRLKEQGIKGLVIDVRGNPGGLLESVVEIADTLLPAKSVIVQVEDKQGNRELTYSSKRQAVDMPMVILVDEGSASASEILAAALQESGGVPVVGTPTFGKGTVQNTLSLEDGSELKLTVAKWLTPKGNWVHEKGVKPDYEVKQPDYFTAVPLNPSTTLKREMNTLEVKNLQMVLKSVGYSPGRDDGYFDQQTENAVKAFQRLSKLPPTGVVDAETAVRLNQALMERMQDKERDLQLQTALKLLEKRVEKQETGQ